MDNTYRIRLTNLASEGAAKRGCRKFDQYLFRKFNTILKTIIHTAQSEKLHRLYKKDNTVKLYDTETFTYIWKQIPYTKGKLPASNIFNPIVFEFLYKGNHQTKLRSAIRIRPLAYESAIELMLERCPVERLKFCNKVYESPLSLHNKCLLISFHIPEFRPSWFAEEPKWSDTMIQLTYESMLAKLEVIESIDQ